MSYMKQNKKKHKQTLESAQYRLEIIFTVGKTGNKYDIFVAVALTILMRKGWGRIKAIEMP